MILNPFTRMEQLDKQGTAYTITLDTVNDELYRDVPVHGHGIYADWLVIQTKEGPIHIRVDHIVSILIDEEQ